MTDTRPTLEEQPDAAAERSDAAGERPGDAAGQPTTRESQRSPGPAPDAPGDPARAFGEAFASRSAASDRQAGGDGGDGGAAADAAEVEEDLSALVQKARQRDEYLALAQRTQADFENYRRRAAKEAASAHERGAISLAKELLPALDNLDRALDAAAQDDPLLEGVRLVRAELAGALARAGIESFSPAGEQFDPALHEAVATAPQDGHDAKPSGTVVEVYQAGYRCREHVIRPARVVVAA